MSVRAPTKSVRDGFRCERGVFRLTEMFAVAEKEEVFHLVGVDNSSERGGRVFWVSGRVNRGFEHADAPGGFWLAAGDAVPHVACSVTGSDLFGDLVGVCVGVSELMRADAVFLELFSEISGIDYYLAAFFLSEPKGGLCRFDGGRELDGFVEFILELGDWG